MVHFKIVKLTGHTVSFDIDLDSSLKAFRQQIGEDHSYSLISDNKICIYDNDPESMTLKQLFVKYAPDLLDKNEIKFYLSINFFPRKRVGVLALHPGNQEKVEEREETNLLICPITLGLISSAVKINGHFYDLFAMARHLRVQYEKYLQAQQFEDGQNFHMQCPHRMNLPRDFVLEIIVHHCLPLDTPVSDSSMESFLLRRSQFQSDQAEYNQLLLEQEAKLPKPAPISPTFTPAAEVATEATRGQKRPRSEEEKELKEEVTEEVKEESAEPPNKKIKI